MPVRSPQPPRIIIAAVRAAPNLSIERVVRMPNARSTFTNCNTNLQSTPRNHLGRWVPEGQHVWCKRTAVFQFSVRIWSAVHTLIVWARILTRKIFLFRNRMIVASRLGEAKIQHCGILPWRSQPYTGYACAAHPLLSPCAVFKRHAWWTNVCLDANTRQLQAP